MGQSIAEPEIKKLMDDQIWGTLIAVDEGQLYAVETSFAIDDQFLYTGTNVKLSRSLEGIDKRADMFTAGEGSLRLYRLPLTNLGGVSFGYR